MLNFRLPLPALLQSCLVALLALGIVADAEAGRRSIRIDLGAWDSAIEFTPFSGSSEDCPGAGVFGEGDPNFPPINHRGYIIWNNLYFQTANFNTPALSSFYCQNSNPYNPGNPNPLYYLNEESFPAEERDLAHFIGPNLNNAVSAIRYSFLGFSGGSYGRQWAFYFFPNDLTVVALYGVPDNGSTYPMESIIDLTLPSADDEWLLWNSQRDGFNGEYFCFQGREYIGDCVPPAPPPPDEIFLDGFE